MAIYCSHNIQPLEMLIQTANFSGKYTGNPLLNQFSISIPIPIMRHSNSHDCTISRFSLLRRMQGGFNTFEIFHYRLFSLERPIFTAGVCAKVIQQAIFIFYFNYTALRTGMFRKREIKSHILFLQWLNQTSKSTTTPTASFSYRSRQLQFSKHHGSSRLSYGGQCPSNLPACSKPYNFASWCSGTYSACGGHRSAYLKGGYSWQTMDLSYEIYFPPQIFFHYKIRCACLTEFLIIAF